MVRRVVDPRRLRLRVRQAVPMQLILELREDSPNVIADLTGRPTHTGWIESGVPSHCHQYVHINGYYLERHVLSRFLPRSVQVDNRDNTLVRARSCDGCTKWTGRTAGPCPTQLTYSDHCEDYRPRRSRKVYCNISNGYPRHINQQIRDVLHQYHLAWDGSLPEGHPLYGLTPHKQVIRDTLLRIGEAIRLGLLEHLEVGRVRVLREIPVPTLCKGCHYWSHTGIGTLSCAVNPSMGMPCSDYRSK